MFIKLAIGFLFVVGLLFVIRRRMRRNSPVILTSRLATLIPRNAPRPRNLVVDAEFEMVPGRK